MTALITRKVIAGYYHTVPELLTSTQPSLGEGAGWTGGQLEFTEAAEDATDYHYITQGGVKLYRDDLETILVGVGPGGDFATYNEALTYLSNRNRGYLKNGVSAQILTLSGFVQEEQVIVRQQDLSWIDILAEDAEVMIDREAITEIVGQGDYAAWAAISNAGLPRIRCLFNMSDTGPSAFRNGIMLMEGSWGIVTPAGAGLHMAGLINAGARAFYVAGSHGRALNCRFDGAGGMGARVSDEGRMNIRNSSVLNAGEEGIVVTGGSQANIEECLVSGAAKTGAYVLDGSKARGAGIEANNCGENGVWVTGGATLMFEGGQANGNTATTNSAGIRCDNGGNVDAQTATVTGNNHNVYANRGGRVNGGGADFSGGITSGVFSLNAEVNLFNANCQRTPGTPTAQDIRVASAGRVYLGGGTLGGTSQPLNEITANGLIVG